MNERQYGRKRERGLTRFEIKLIAAAAMTMNHIAFVLMREGQTAARILEYAGYFTAITMCCFLVEGYHRTSSRKKYARRLLLFALLSQIPYHLAVGNAGRGAAPLNMFFTLLICFLITEAYNRFCMQPPLRTAAILVLAVLSFCCDWAGMAPFFTVLFNRVHEGRMKMKEAYAAAAAGFGGLMAMGNLSAGMPGLEALLLGGLSTAGIWLSAFCMIRLYNGRQGNVAGSAGKWFFYVYYPLHLAVLVLIRNMV